MSRLSEKDNLYALNNSSSILLIDATKPKKNSFGQWTMNLNLLISVICKIISSYKNENQLLSRNNSSSKLIRIYNTKTNKSLVTLPINPVKLSKTNKSTINRNPISQSFYITNTSSIKSSKLSVIYKFRNVYEKIKILSGMYNKKLQSHLYQRK